jgi:hypothetical protein
MRRCYIPASEPGVATMRNCPTLILTTLLGFGAVAGADTLEVPPAAERVPGALPDRGLTMAQVEARFGAPSERKAAVGNPPIERWVYPGFTVFFEHQWVLHAIPAPAIRSAAVATPTDAEPAPAE